MKLSFDDLRRGLSVRQPFAGQIADGTKTVEIRSRRTSYRGPLVVCASARPCDCGPVGVTVCVVDVVGCEPLGSKHRRGWGTAYSARETPEEGLWAWLLAFRARLPAVPLSGRLGIFHMSRTESRRILDALR